MNELFKEDETEWNEDLVNSILWEDEAKAILSIHLDKNLMKDKLIWDLIKNLVFIVKSAYFSVKNLKDEGLGNSSNTKKHSSKCKLVW